MKTVVLVDFLMGGHHAGWLVEFAEGLLRLENRVVCLCLEPETISSRVADKASEYLKNLEVVKITNPTYPKLRYRWLRKFVETLARWRCVARTLGGTGHDHPKPDLVFFAWLDDCLVGGLHPRLLDLVFPYRWAGLYFHPRYERLPTANGRKRPAYLRADLCLRARNCTAICILDEGIATSFKRHLKSKPVLLFPDLAPHTTATDRSAWVQKIREKAGKRTVVGAIGSLERRKGISTLLQVAKGSNVKDFFFVFAGPLARSTFPEDELEKWDETIANPPDNCLFHLQWIDEVDQVVASCDLVYAAYQDFPHSSELMTRAARFRKPLVVSSGYCMGERLDRFRIGETMREGDPAGCVAALHAVNTRIHNGGYPGSEFQQYEVEHSAVGLEKCLKQLLTLASN